MIRGLSFQKSKDGFLYQSGSYPEIETWKYFNRELNIKNSPPGIREQKMDFITNNSK